MTFLALSYSLSKPPNAPPSSLCDPKMGPKSWICGNGQKLGVAPSFQH